MYQEVLFNDIEELREYLRDYYGTAMQQFPMAVVDLTEIDEMSDSQVLEEVRRLGL